MRARVIKFVGLVVVMAAALAAPAGASRQAAPSPRLPNPTTIKMLKVPYFALEQIASAKGFFSKYNLNVDYVTQVAQGVAGVPAIVSNQVQTGQGFGVNTPIQAAAGGAKIKIVFAGGLSDYGDYRLYSKTGSGINKASDVAGKTVGVVTLGAYPDIALQVWLYDNHVDLSKVKRVQLPLNTMCDALVHGQVDLVMMYSLFWKQCEAAHGSEIHQLFKDSDVLPSAELYEAYIFTDDYSKSNPDVVRAWVAGMKDAAAYVKADPDGAKQIISQVTGISADLLIPQNQPPGNCVDPRALSQWVTLLANYGAIAKGSVDYKTLYTNQFNPGCDQILAKAATVRVAVAAGDRALRVAPATVAAGARVVFVVRNIGKLSHSFAIGGKTSPLIRPGRTTKLVVSFTNRGSFAYRLATPGRGSRVMGKLVVTP